MAYSAVVSLKITINRLLNSSRISFVPPSRQILEFAYRKMKSVQDIFNQRVDDSGRDISCQSERAKALEEEIRQSVCELEDVLEYHVSNQIVSQSEKHPLLFSVDLLELTQVVGCFSKTIKNMAEKYGKELDNRDLPEVEEGEKVVVSSTAYFGGEMSRMVGLIDKYDEVREAVTTRWPHPRFFALIGMAGIGKTTMAKKIFEDPLVKEMFDSRIFVSVGQKCRVKETVEAIKAELNGDNHIEEDVSDWDCMYGRRCLVVLDDVWDPDLLTQLEERISGGIMYFVTSRLLEVGIILERENMIEMRFLNKEESWELLCEKVFGEAVCNPQLEKAGKKIAENCEGLALLIVTIADLLSKDEKTPEHWGKIAEDKQNPVFEKAYDLILEVLYPSYNNLPLLLKPCFLYMAVFPPDKKVHLSRLINLLIAAEFLEIEPGEQPECFLDKCIKNLYANNVVVFEDNSMFELKACGLHSVFWHLAKKEGGKNKFLHILNRYGDELEESIEGQRHLSIFKNILLSIKDVYSSISSVTNAHSLLCTGAYTQYQVPICFSLRLLRVLDTLTIRFYEFPMEVFELVLLRHLALTYNGNLPPSICKLWSLQYLIVHQHQTIRSIMAQSYLPVEIWDLQELKYLQIVGRNLPVPPLGVVLPKLSTLLDVGPNSCKESVLKGIPSLEKLRVQVEISPHVAAQSLSYFDYISHLCELKSLQYVVLNPDIVAPPPPLLVSTSNIKKLTLSGLGYPWNEMNKIAALPSLEVLKLQCFAFRGEKWNMKENEFSKLERLYIEDTDLVQWTIGRKAIPQLNVLSMKNCYRLQEIPTISKVWEIRLVDCNPSAAVSAEQVKPFFCNVCVHYSWEDRNLKS